MRYGFVIPTGDIPEIVALGREIEATGWDGVFVGDGVYGTDLWVTLGAIAAVTERVVLGPLLTPASRRRPWKLASEAATLDRLSGGRAVVPVGMGALDTGFAAVGEATERRVRAERLDECLELVTRFWAGKPFRFAGRHYTVSWDDAVPFNPVQTPRIPIWVAALWPSKRSMARPLRFDGVLPNVRASVDLPPVIESSDGAYGQVTPAHVAEIARYVADHRPVRTPFEIVAEGVTPLGDPDGAAAIVQPYGDAGATWWIESMWDAPGGLAAVRARVAQGPTRTDH